MHLWRMFAAGLSIITATVILVRTTDQATTLLEDRSTVFKFVPHTIATELRGGYQPLVTDMNRDHRPDIVTLALS